MLPRKRRLPRESIRSLQKRKASGTVRGQDFLARFADNGGKTNRYAVTVGVKVDKRSTKRHFLRRRVESRMLGWRDGGQDVLVSVLPSAAKLPFSELGKELSEIGNRILQTGNRTGA